jgi:hypothetical protein
MTMSESREPESVVETGTEELFGTTVADDRHVSAAEAEAARNTHEVEEELPPEDPDFDEDDEEFE